LIPMTIGKAAPEWHWKAAKATDMVLAITHHIETKDPVQLRQAIIGHAREALSDLTDETMFHCPTGDLGEGEGPQPTPVASAAGIFRLVLDDSPLNHLNPIDAESFMLVVQRRVDEVLADPVILGQICGGIRGG
jgi:hypothetical protein